MSNCSEIAAYNAYTLFHILTKRDFNFVSLIGMTWYLTVALIKISLITNGMENVCVYTLLECLLHSVFASHVPVFPIGFLIKLSLYIFLTHSFLSIHVQLSSGLGLDCSLFK